MSELKALVGVDFALIGTKLQAVYEQKEDGYTILLIPSEQNADTGVSIGQVIADIKKLVSSSGSEASTEDMEKELTESLSGLSDGKDGFDLDKIVVKLNMAYLYINKEKEENAETEYAFQLQIVTEGLIPKAVAQLVDVNNVSLSLWNTTRQKVIEKMRLIKIDEYIGIPAIAGDA